MNYTKKAQASGLLSLIGGMILVCAFALGFIYFNQGGNTNYGVPFNQSQYNAFNQSQQIINLTQNTQSQFIQFNSSGTSTLDIITVITTGGYNTLKIIGGIPGIYFSTLTGAGTILGIPQEIVYLVFYYIIAIIITIFILLVFRVRS